MAEEVGVGESGLVVVPTVDCTLNLKAIAMKAQNAKYKQNRLGALIMRIREPKTTALIFNSGKVICTGAKSEESSKLAARKYGRIIQKLGFPAKFTDFKILNVVSSCDVKFPVRLEMLKAYHYKFADYDPEIFPGLIYRMVQPKVTITLENT